MCLRNFQDVTNRTLLFIIVLLSLKLCSPQDLNEEFVNEDSIEPADVMVPVKVKTRSEGPCRLSEILCDTGQCLSLDKYCNGEDDCGDKSDEPKSCTREYTALIRALRTCSAFSYFVSMVHETMPQYCKAQN